MNNVTVSSWRTSVVMGMSVVAVTGTISVALVAILRQDSLPLVAALSAMTAGTVAVLAGLLKIEEQHKAVNSRLTELIEAQRLLAHAAGLAEGKETAARVLARSLLDEAKDVAEAALTEVAGKAESLLATARREEGRQSGRVWGGPP